MNNCRCNSTIGCKQCNPLFKEETKPSNIEQDWIRLFQDRIKGVIGEYSSQLNDWSFVEERIVEEIQKTVPELLQSQRTKLIDEIVGLVDECRWVSGTHFVINGKQEKMISKTELKTKLIELKEKV